MLLRLATCGAAQLAAPGRGFAAGRKQLLQQCSGMPARSTITTTGALFRLKQSDAWPLQHGCYRYQLSCCDSAAAVRTAASPRRPTVRVYATERSSKRNFPYGGYDLAKANGTALDSVDSIDADIEFSEAQDDDTDDSSLGRIMNTVVKIYCVHTEPNYSLPWQRKRQYASTSSGFIIWGPEGQRWLLTNAHSVEYHTQVKVKRRGDDTKYIAEVLAVGVECDIALLTVEDEAFWEGAEPLTFGDLPKLQDPVAVVGYPIGGDTISVTSGVVSRIEVTSYAHGASELLGVQIDAAINSGNSGGPVFNQTGDCVGIAFQSMSGGDAENIGYVIPTPVIFHFLTDFIRNGTFTGFPVLGVQWQRMESKALRSAYKMGSGHKGVLARYVSKCAKAYGVLRPDDIVMRFDGVQVTNDGTVPFRTGERIAFTYLISQKFAGEKAQVDVLRDGEELSLEIELSTPPRLVPCHIEGKQPQYLLVSGLVFTVCCEPYLASEYGMDYGSDAPVKLLDKLVHGQAETVDEQVVVLSQVLACDATLGYEDIYNVQVLALNDQKIKNLAHLKQLVDNCTEPYMRFKLEYTEVLILETEASRTSTEEILAAHSIPFSSSADLR